jgi:hypothetical protein
MKIRKLAGIAMVVMASLAIAGFLQAKMTFQPLPLRTAPEVLEPAPSGFYGGMGFYDTNIALGWSNSPGVVRYWVQRGITSTNPGDYIWTQFCLSSNASFFVDSNILNEEGLNVYRLFAEYPTGKMSDTDVWYASWEDDDPSFDEPPNWPPKPQSIQASVDSVSNVVITWSPAEGPATNYIVIRGAYNPANTNGYDFTIIGAVDAGTTRFKTVGVIKSTNDLGDIYEVGAIYPGNTLSAFAACYVDTNVADRYLLQNGDGMQTAPSF